MSNTPFAAKRTRSQLALPDDILHVPERSPMKDARTALRHHTTGVAGRRRDGSSESDDELLLSPGKTSSQPRKDSQQHIMLTHKRSASPQIGDEYTSRFDSPSDGRASKRIKRDVDVDQDEQRRAENVTTFESRLHFAHSRSASQPIMENPTCAQSALDQQPTRTSPLPGKGRARSVPIFSSYAVPHIDLRNPPTSPWRARSRSPSKEREIKLRITSGPTQIAKLETIADDIGADVYTDGTILAPSAGIPLALSTSNAGGDFDQDDRSARPPAPAVRELPSTPATTQRLSLTFPLSPLTPLPPTPLPSRSVHISKDRCMTAGWETDRDEGDKDDVMEVTSQESKPLPKLGTTMKSRLPRPSSMMNISVTSTPRPSPTLALNQQSTTVMGPPSAFPAAKQSLPSDLTKQIRVTAKPTSSKPSMQNAFDILMGPAHRGTTQPKGKAKGKTSSTKAGSSSSVSTIVSKQKSRDGDKQEMAQPKISIKAKMRPKEKTKLKPKPTSALVKINDDDDDAHSPPSRALSPMHVPESDTLFTTALEDIPVMAVFASDGDVNMSPSVMQPHVNVFQRATTPPRMDVPAVVAHATLAATPPPQSDVARTSSLSEASMVVAVEQSTNSESPEASQMHSEPAFADVDPEPPSRVASKLPLVKKAGLAATTDRVTRRMSQRQREKRAESTSQALHKASATHRSTMRKAADSKDSRAEIVSASAPQDPDASMSSIPDVATDPVPEEPMPEESVPPGSPMKLDAPVCEVSKVPEDTNVSSTRSSTAKTVLPKTSSRPRFPSKPSSSPIKLVRSASMNSARPSGGLARTLTEFGDNQGSSSLSTLANALEKLRMPPPERPNTSMGFNRELDTSHDLELTRYSTDDSFVGGHGLESTDAASVGPVESDHRGSGEAGGSEKSRVPEQKFSSLFRRERVGTTRLQSGSGLIMRGGKAAGSLQHKPRIIGSTAFGSGRVPKASRKTTLPSVMASPVKGNGAMEEAEMVSTNVDVAPGSHANASSVVCLATNVGKGESSRGSPSRRVSLASQALSQSLSSLPSKQTQVMGPPTTPPNRRPGLRSSSSSYPCSSSSGPRQTSDTAMPGSAPIAHGKVKSGVEGHISFGNFTGHATASSNMISESLKILQDCVIFVDVRTDDGDEAASLFVEMLEGVGAKILTRVGQTCTHIVYKNGLMSTLTRYRLLRDPKPLVVGIAWVVECVEQRKRVDESKFIVDLDGVNVAGTNKRRRSMLPKLIRREAEGIRSPDAEERQVTECDQSMDGSSSSMTIDEILTPLELARRRRTEMRTS